MRLLVIRTSAMGDVALTTPVLKAMREAYPEVEMILLTREAFNPFFRSIKGISIFYIPILKAGIKAFQDFLNFSGTLLLRGKLTMLLICMMCSGRKS